MAPQEALEAQSVARGRKSSERDKGNTQQDEDNQAKEVTKIEYK